MPIFLLSQLAALAFAATSHAKVDSEAFWAVEIKGKPVGFTVQREETDPASGQRTTSYLMKTTSADNDMEEFVTIKQTRSLVPLSYRFDSVVRGLELHAEGRVKGTRMDVAFRDADGPKDSKPFDLHSGTLFATSVTKLLARQKLAPGQAYSFDAISEEDHNRAPGEALVLDSAAAGKHHVYRLVLRFMNLEHEAWMLEDGMVLRTESTTLPVRSVLVADGAQAMRDIDQGGSILKKYFKDRVKGESNPVAKGEVTVDDALFTKPRNLDAFARRPRIPLKVSR